MNDRHYVPILKGKRGEFDALQQIDDALKSAISPLVEIVTEPWDYVEDVARKSLEDHLGDIARQLNAKWASPEPVLVDTIWLSPDSAAGGRHHLVYLFDALRGETNAIPVGGLARSPAHLAAVSTIAAADGRGACLRVDADDIADSASLTVAIDGWLRTTGVGPDQVDLVIDLGAVDTDSQATARIAATMVLGSLPHLQLWRSLVVAAGAFPQFLTDVQSESEQLIDRLDWQLYAGLRQGQLDRIPSFGDYAIAHPSLLEADPRTLRPTASIRYAGAEHWMIVKRRWVRSGSGYGQFNDASAILIGLPEFVGAAHCHACGFIDVCAGGGATGNLTTWRAAGTCHHLTTTAAQLASLP